MCFFAFHFAAFGLSVSQSGERRILYCRFRKGATFFMTIIFFISEDYVWTSSVSEKIFSCFCENIGKSKAVVLSDGNRFCDEIREIINKYKQTGNAGFVSEIQFGELKYDTEEEYQSKIENSDLLFIDEKRKREIAYRYIPYSYRGKFFFI